MAAKKKTAKAVPAKKRAPKGTKAAKIDTKKKLAAAPKKATKSAPKKRSAAKPAPAKAKSAPKKKNAAAKVGARGRDAYAAFAAAARKAAPLAEAGNDAKVVDVLRPYVRALPDMPPPRGAGDEGVALAFALLARSLDALGQSDVAAAALEAAAAWSPS